MQLHGALSQKSLTRVEYFQVIVMILTVQVLALCQVVFSALCLYQQSLERDSRGSHFPYQSKQLVSKPGLRLKQAQSIDYMFLHSCPVNTLLPSVSFYLNCISMFFGPSFLMSSPPTLRTPFPCAHSQQLGFGSLILLVIVLL